MIFFKNIFILLSTAFFINTAVSQTFTAQASKTKVAVGEMFELTYSINASGNNFKAPSLSDFDVYEGPSHYTSVSIINGSMTQSISYSYVIAAKKEGKFTIGPAAITTTSGLVRSNSITIEVIKGSGTAKQNTNPNNPQNYDQNVTPPSSQDLGDNLFVKTSSNKSKVFLGEEITMTHKLYRRIDVLQLSVSKLPTFEGFYMQEGKVNNETTENIDGVNYLVYEIKRTFLVPLKTGKQTVNPMEVECMIRRPSGKKVRNFFGMLVETYENATVKLKSNSLSVDVIPLPEEGKPENFSGAVGNYSMKAQLTKDKIKANESINLTIDVSGKGNIKLIDPFKIKFPDDFELYDPKTTEKIIAGSGGISGSKKFDYLFIPRYPGDYTIDNIGFNYFDPEKKQYVSIPSPSFKIHVDKGDGVANQASVFNPRDKEDVKVLGTDIRYIKTNDLNLKQKNDYFFGTIKFYSGLISPMLAFFAFIIIRKKRIEENKDLVSLKSRKANKMAKKRLAIAEKHIRTNNKDEFYIEISKALFGYLSDKLNLPTADLTQDNISQMLKNKNVSDSTISQLIETISNCEYAKYAPTAVSGDLKGIYLKTVELITSIENELK